MKFEVQAWGKVSSDNNFDDEAVRFTFNYHTIPDHKKIVDMGIKPMLNKYNKLHKDKATRVAYYDWQVLLKLNDGTALEINDICDLANKVTRKKQDPKYCPNSVKTLQKQLNKEIKLLKKWENRK